MKSDYLFTLIKSLSKSEKIYFKKYGYKDGNQRTPYIKLYDIIEGQLLYDEVLVKKQLSRETLLKQFSVAKNYLGRLIMKSLRDYYADQSASQKLDTLLEDINILLNKGLNNQCRKLVSRAWKLASKYEMSDYKKRILSLEYTLLNNIQHAKESNEKFDLLLEQESTLLKHFDLVFQFKKLTAILFFILKKEAALSNADKKNIQKILSDPLLKRDPKNYSSAEKNYYYLITSTGNFQLGNLDLSYNYVKKHLAHIESRPLLLDVNPKPYLNTLFNYTEICIKLGKINEALASIKKTKEKYSIYMQRKNKNKGHQNTYLGIYNQELMLLIKLGELKKAQKITQQIKQDIDISQISEERMIAQLYQQVMKVLFANKDYKEALWWTNRVSLKDMKSSMTYRYVSIISILIHYELGNAEKIISLVRSMRRALVKSKDKYPVLEIVLSFFYQSSVRENKKEEEKALALLKEKLMSLVDKHTKQASILNVFDFIPWIDSKIEKQSLVKLNNNL